MRKISFLLLFVVSCGVENKTSVQGDKGFRAALSPQPTSVFTNPIILVPGWGYDYSDKYLGHEVYASYIQWLVESGVARENIHVVDYSYNDDLETIRKEMKPQLAKILASYPPETRFDIFGHSLGGFVALWGVYENGFGSRFHKFVSLSGIPLGWNGKYCKTGICGKAHLDLVPYKSKFVMSFHKKHEAELANLEKCSLFSKVDGMVFPYDAGRFPDGTNVEAHRMQHMEVVWKKQYFDLMKERCY